LPQKIVKHPNPRGSVGKAAAKDNVGGKNRIAIFAAKDYSDGSFPIGRGRAI